jgi:lipopolysaccharide transport system ATP-binding protein
LLNWYEAGMTTPSIEFNGVWKKFRRGEVHDSLRDLIPALAGRMIGRKRDVGQLGDQEFWALQDVSFKVGTGEALGIIGGNGAGKSTALKTLTNVLQPNRGWSKINGRAGSLIEIAAGFHQDLTGRENIYLQGVIMGMPRELIQRRFDEIVEFSGIETFLDTPVKRYSSGMNARLGFAIAAHLDPEVLVVDEVLSVGDASFQQRAFGRLTALVKSGIPVVIVSHQLERVASLCTRCLLLDQGKVAYDGTPADTIAEYLSGVRAQDGSIHIEEETPLSVSSINVINNSELIAGECAEIHIQGNILDDHPDTFRELGIRVRSAQHGSVIFATTTKMCGLDLPTEKTFQLQLQLDLNVEPGVYNIETYIYSPELERDTYVGPTTHVHVLPDRRFVGNIHLNPRISIV